MEEDGVVKGWERSAACGKQRGDELGLGGGALHYLYSTAAQQEEQPDEGRCGAGWGVASFHLHPKPASAVEETLESAVISPLFWWRKNSPLTQQTHCTDVVGVNSGVPMALGVAQRLHNVRTAFLFSQ
eukprot:scaffold816_cov156-Ochromonas_danica.AAC.1